MALGGERASIFLSVGDNWPNNGTLHYYLDVPSKISSVFKNSSVLDAGRLGEFLDQTRSALEGTLRNSPGTGRSVMRF
jgi:hypothetical protein